MTWNKFKCGNLVYYNCNAHYHYAERSTTDVDKLNELGDDKFSLAYPHGLYTQEEKEAEFEKLPAGVYKHMTINHSTALVEMQITAGDKILDLTSVHDLIKDFESFKDKREVYKSLGLLHKRGVLLYGPPGTGKTSAIHEVVSSIIGEVVVVFINKHISFEIRKALSKDDRLKVIVFEEMTDALNSMDHDQQAFLDFLDGESSMDNTFIMATTNFPEKLPSNIVSRPGRFDKFYKVGYLSKEDSKIYLKHILKREVTEAELELCNKATIASLKEIALISLRDDKTLTEAFQILEDQLELARSEFKDKKKDKELGNSIL